MSEDKISEKDMKTYKEVENSKGLYIFILQSINFIEEMNFIF